MIEREPFRLAFRDAAGRTVLLTISHPPTPTAAQNLPATRDPEPLALEQEPDNAVYAPLTLEVGREQRMQWTGSFWPGNMLFARHSGVVHIALAVRAVQRAGAGVRLVVATTHSRRPLIVRVAPGRSGSFRGLPRLRRGHQSTDQRGQKLYGWVLDRPARAMGGLTAITGRHRLPPAWSQGAVLWRAIQVGEIPETRASVQAKIDADLAQIGRRRAPVRGCPSRLEPARAPAHAGGHRPPAPDGDQGGPLRARAPRTRVPVRGAASRSAGPPATAAG